MIEIISIKIKSQKEINSIISKLKKDDLDIKIKDSIEGTDFSNNLDFENEDWYLVKDENSVILSKDDFFTKKGIKKISDNIKINIKEINSYMFLKLNENEINESLKLNLL